MSRRPAITSLLKGQEVKTALGSIRMTCKFACARFSARAHAAPPKPPPTTTTRPADCARRIEGTANDVAAAAMPRKASRRVTDAFMSLVRKESMPRRASWPPRHVSGEGDVLVAQWHRTDAFARRREVRIEHRRRRDADGRLADAAPETAARHHYRFDLRHLVDAHRIVGVEVGLLDLAVLDGAAAVEQRGEAIDEGARDLPLHLGRIDDVAGIGGGDDTMYLDLVAVGHRDFGGAGDIAAIAHHLRNAPIDALWRRGAPADLLGHGVEHRQMF